MNRNLNLDFCIFAFFITGIDKILSREGFSPDKKAPSDKGTPQPSNKVIDVSGLGIPEGKYSQYPNRNQYLYIDTNKFAKLSTFKAQNRNLLKI